MKHIFEVGKIFISRLLNIFQTFVFFSNITPNTGKTGVIEDERETRVSPRPFCQRSRKDYMVKTVWSEITREERGDRFSTGAASERVQNTFGANAIVLESLRGRV